MGQQVEKNWGQESTEAATARMAPLAEVNALVEEIVDLYYDQLFSENGINTPKAVCKAFSDILARRWNLSSMIIYLRDEGNHLNEIAVCADEHLSEAEASHVGAQLAAALEHEGQELHVWLDEEESGGPNGAETRRALSEAGMRAAVAVPIHAHGSLVGAVVVVTPFPERLRVALSGLRFIAPPIMIAVGNARRTAAIREQHSRIQHLIAESEARRRELEEANRELRRVSHYRSLFLARMSHELRTPLTSILGFSEILLDHESLTDSQRRFCEKIQSSGHQLQSSLNQLVDLSRLEAGQTELFLHEFSLREALRDSGQAVSRLAKKREVKIACETESDIHTIVSDEGKLRQVFYNFMAHAISRTPAQGTVRVGLQQISPTHFCVRIEDEGETIEDLSRIFEPVNIEAPTETASNMNELGLAIARRLIDVLGGRVELESKPPRGLRVLIQLPIRPMK
ncbi:MAG: HAMP domain-containing histidine kinase [Pyrinomonadaceae bacterium]|nr:HAMP domain-containing histidine kinase [Pyrinomonadaceae bacterium]